MVIFCKVNNMKDKTFWKMTIGSFICREIVNALEISNNFINELFSLLSLDSYNLNEYMTQKSIYN